MILRTGTYFLEVYGLLLRLEQAVEPKPLRSPPLMPKTSSPGIPVPVFVLPAIRNPITLRWVLEEIKRVEADSKDLGLESTAKRLKHIRSYLDANSDRLSASMDKFGDAKMQSEVRSLREAIIDDLEERWIFFPDFAKYNKYWAKLTARLGREILEAFQPAYKDMVGAYNCYVLDEWTASVFHSMRVAEYGLAALAKRIKPAMRTDKLDWGPIIRDLRKRIEDLHAAGKKKLTRSREKQLEFYSEALDQCVFFKRFRDDTMHTRGYYEEPEALQILTHVEEFLRSLTDHGLHPPKGFVSSFTVNIHLEPKGT